MDLLPSEEQQQIIETSKHFLAREFPVAAALQLAEGETRFQRQHLEQIARMGWIGIGLPEDHGGVGYGLVEEVLLCIELGRNLMPPSVLASLLAARLTALSGANHLLETLLEGTTGVAMAVATGDSPVAISAQVSGEFLVYEAAHAELVLVADEHHAALLDLSSLERVATGRCIDGTIDVSHWRATDVRAAAELPVTADPLFLRGALLVSAAQLGIAEATLERSVNYAGEREQFGKPIGSFQAIKHYCAEMAIRCESVRAMLYHASISLQQDHTSGQFDTHTAKALASEAAQLNANTAVQIHGGMGFTQEMDIHLFVKRSQVLATLFGNERYHLGKLLQQSRPD